MNLLPKNTTPKSFSQADYWTDFFSNRNTKDFEWYADFRSINQLLTRLCKDKNGTKFLNVGCGNSTLGFDLFQFGYLNVINIDLNQLVINQMQSKYKEHVNDKFKFVKMDVFNLEFDENEFNVVLDKGTLDAIASDNSESTTENLFKMFDQIEKVLAPLGKYICVSLLQEHILNAFFNWINRSKFNYIVRIYRLKTDELGASKSKYPVFMIVATKLKAKVNSENKSLYELCLNEEYDAKPIRTLDANVAIDLIKEIHSYNLILAHIRNKSLQDDELCFELFDDTNINEYKYKLFITEQFSRENKMKFAIFIIPLGREREYLFSTREGRRDVCRLSTAQRCVFVALNANYKDYPFDMQGIDLKAIQNELSPKVMEFAPQAYHLNLNQKVPYLTVQDQERETIYKGRSDFSGDYGVFDVKTEEKGKEVMLRQLIFDSNKQLIQSECKIIQTRKKKKIVKQVDHSYLACLHHGAIISGICLFKYYFQDSLEENLENLQLANDRPEKVYRILLIGLGGGCLINFLNHNLKLEDNSRVEFDVVEIDETMVNIAKNWFDLNEHLRVDKFKIRIHIQDGLVYLKEFKESNHYDMVIFDIDNKSSSSGLSCPPTEFLEQKTLDNVKRILKNESSVFMLNLAARNNSIKQAMENRLKGNFKQVNKYRIPDEINNIFYCWTSVVKLNDFNDKEKTLGDRIKKFIELFKSTINRDEIQSLIDVCDFVSYLN